MKKIKLNAAKLQLNKEKVTELNSQEMNQINGGLLSIISCHTQANYACSGCAFCCPKTLNPQ